MSVENKTYESGFYFLGVSHSFIIYPKTVQQLEFSKDADADYTLLHSRTNDGLEVQLEISFQYRLQKDKIYDLFSTFKKEYKKVFKNMAIDIISEHATRYEAYEFFVNRTHIGQSMHRELNSIFTKNCFADIEFFQLRSVDLPDKFEDSISETEVYKQNINKAAAEKEKVQVELETLLKKAEYQKQITELVAEGDAIEIYSSGYAEANSLLIKQHASAQSFQAVKKALNLDDEQLVQYVLDKVIRKQKEQSLVVNLERRSKWSANKE
ncbi:hypothetical protein PPERSA_05811 [Pseudocohnilembus persalinus]|uniref:Band 7 domain-containing protein n=1 Tax=Pseudocohnilembus persalinus TaxID=266149 RepID=A0A0V0QG76_PSEPJ|nr:hypothetical protein PPERSA_05811 [Pseudocohnilembus persalinus]|eukprot:KRX01225.1 hypothetical protein PPERSA_05811 [Pseudocohnilembus persalinus]